MKQSVAIPGWIDEVAPHAGALVETSDITKRKKPLEVAPHAGALVETYQLTIPTALKMSRLTQAR